jgi:hypothetical protein
MNTSLQAPVAPAATSPHFSQLSLTVPRVLGLVLVFAEGSCGIKVAWRGGATSTIRFHSLPDQYLVYYDNI